MILSLSLYLSIFLSLCLSLSVFNSEVSLDPSWRNGIRDERSVRLRRLSLSLRADQTGRLLEIDGIARMTGKVSVQCRKKSKSFERVGEGEGRNRLTEKSREGKEGSVSKVLEMESWRRLVDSLEEETSVSARVYVYVCVEIRGIVRTGLTEVIKSSKWILRWDMLVKRKVTCILLRGIIRFSEF